MLFNSNFLIKQKINFDEKLRFEVFKFNFFDETKYIT